MVSSHKADALTEIATLIKQFNLSGEDLLPLLKEPTLEQKKEESASLLVTLFSYFGGIFIFSGIAALIGMFWGDMNSYSRVIITLGTGFFAYLMAISFTKDGRFEKAVTPLFLIAALMQPGGMFVLLHEIFPPSNDPRLAVLLVFGCIFLQQLFTFIALKRTTLLFMTLLFGFSALLILFDMLNVRYELMYLSIATSALFLMAGIEKTAHRSITGFGYFIATPMFLWSVWDIIESTMFEIGFMLLTSYLIYMSTMVRSRVLLICGTIGMISYIGYYTTEYFLDSIGWPLALIFIGFAMLGLSGFSYKLSKKF